jgi:hypothetical protein
VFGWNGVNDREANRMDVRSNLRIDHFAGMKLAQAGGVLAYCLRRLAQIVRRPDDNGEAVHVAQATVRRPVFLL